MSSLRLEVVAGQATGMSIHVDRELLVGRHVDGAGRLAGDEELSREHARITVEDDGVCAVEDLGSMNGTYVNGKRISSPKTLKEGDTVECGATTLVVRELPEPAAAQEPRGGAAPAASRVTAARSKVREPAQSDQVSVAEVAAEPADEAAAQGSGKAAAQGSGKAAAQGSGKAASQASGKAAAQGSGKAASQASGKAASQASGKAAAQGSGKAASQASAVAAQPSGEADAAESVAAAPDRPDAPQLASPPALALRVTLQLGVTFDPSRGSAALVVGDGSAPIELVLAEGAWQVKRPA